MEPITQATLAEKLVTLAKELTFQISLLPSLCDATSALHVATVPANIVVLLSRLDPLRAEIDVAYRKKLIEAKQTEGSIAGAEAVAKTSDEYLLHQKIDNLVKTAIEAGMVGKKIMDALHAEGKRT